MNIGDLRHCGTIEQLTLTPDGIGGQTQSWSTFTSRKMKIEPLSAKQRWFAQKLEHNVSHVVTLRYLDGVTHDMRVKTRTGKYLYIRGMKNQDERGIWLDLYCEEGVGS